MYRIARFTLATTLIIGFFAFIGLTITSFYTLKTVNICSIYPGDIHCVGDYSLMCRENSISCAVAQVKKGNTSYPVIHYTTKPMKCRIVGIRSFNVVKLIAPSNDTVTIKAKCDDGGKTFALLFGLGQGFYLISASSYLLLRLLDVRELRLSLESRNIIV